MPLLNRAQLDFVLFDWLRLDDLLAKPRFSDHSREVVVSLLDLANDIAEGEFLSHYKKSDQVEPTLVDGVVRVLPDVATAVRTFVEAGFVAGPLPREVGGLQFPYIVHSAAMASFFAANIATAAYPMLTVANANLLAVFATERQVEAFLKPQLEGAALGTMCLSEPQAGSSLGDILTRAEADGSDECGQRFRLFGNKMWISAGDHDVANNIVHLVLAKEPGPDGKLVPGPKGISLFVCPKLMPDGRRNDIVVAGLNHKMGYRGTSNCLLNFGEGLHRPGGQAGAVAYRIGESGQGLAIMFHMMNEARIGVGLGAAALACRGYQQALRYSKERLQGRPHEARGVETGPVPLIRHPDVRLMLLSQKAYAEGALALSLFCASLVDEENSANTPQEKARAGALLGLLTPVAKTWPSEWGLAANDLAIQVHGGYGYTRDFEVEQLYRDNRLNPIHEGTTGIQAIDLVGRKLLKDHQNAVGLLDERIARTVVRTRHALPIESEQVGQAWEDVRAAIESIQRLDDPGRAMWNATPFLRAFGHVVVGWLWLDQAGAALALDPERLRPLTKGVIAACEYFMRYELRKLPAWLEVVHQTEGVAVRLPEDAF